MPPLPSFPRKRESNAAKAARYQSPERATCSQHGATPRDSVIIMIKALKGRPKKNGGECHYGRDFGFAVFAGLCPAKEWDALSGLDTLKCRLTGRCPVL
ncbi:MAG: hypothetical protein ACR2P4_02180 [Gammaproteobacteria bacterium]